jgi:uncharacterized alpha-E superfamily protein
MWLHINIFHGQIRALGEADLAPENVSRLCAMLKEGCQAHAGISEGTFYRDQSWRFYALGRDLERADQTSRLLDVAYQAMQTTVGGVAELASAPWITLLRAAAGYHAYRRVHPAGFAIAEVVAFLLLDMAFPRSVSLNLARAGRQLEVLAGYYGLPLAAALERLRGLRAMLDERSVEAGLQAGLSPMLDRVQAEIGALYGDVARAVFA